MKSAVILCGGKGTRFGSDIKGIQKCCIPLKNSTPIEMVIQQLRSNSINHFVFLTGFEAEKSEETIKSYMTENEDFQFIRNKKASSTAEAMIEAFEELPDYFIYHHGNILLASKYYNLIDIEYKHSNRIFLCDLSIKITHPVIKVNKNFVIDIRRQLPDIYNNDCWYYSVGMSFLSKDCFSKDLLNIKYEVDKTTEQLLIPSMLEYTIVEEEWMHIETYNDLIRYG